MSSIEWDPAKAQSNLKKHEVAFSDAVIVLEDQRALTIEDEHPQERRFITLGADASGRLLVVVYTFRGDVVRLISARKATSRERKMYEEGSE